LKGKTEDSLDSFLGSIEAADIVVVAGMGGITDAFQDYAFQLLDTLDLAIHLGKITAMFSQGMGPIESSKLRARAQEVLSRVDLIALRESRAGVPLLDSLKVARERILVTGDDAIEAAFDRRASCPGDRLGVNVRSADYSGVGQCSLEQLRPILLETVGACGASIAAVPTSRHPSERDSSTLRLLLAGYDSVSDYGEGLDTPHKVIEQIKHCRVLVTGSYHAAVFALAQGTPVVCLVNSGYYADKFLGLLAQFPGGGEVVSLQDGQLRTRFRDAVTKMWGSAEQVRPELLASARRQIQLGHAAYQRLHDIVCVKRGESQCALTASDV
jgi:polysaccharide pyruvyl transferase WcaK-like protein